MSYRFCYGTNAQCELDSEIAAWIGPDAATTTAVDAVRGLRSALRAPLDFPALAEATVPGDTVSVAVANSLPQREAVAVGATAALCDAGVDPGLITIVLQSPLEHPERFAQGCAALDLAPPAIEVHDPRDESSCSMVGVMQTDQPLRINRHLAEADLVLPILSQSSTAYRPHDASPFAGLYPEFATLADHEPFYAPQAVESAVQKRTRTAEADEAGWLMGILLTVRIVPGPRGTVAGVFAGQPAAVAREARQLCQSIWTSASDARGDLVVASLVGEPADQTWSNVARALLAAQEFNTRGGAIVICTQVRDRPGKSLRRLAASPDYSATERELRRDRTREARAATILARAVAQGTVYLMSELPPRTVESLGMTPVANEQELNRLLHNYHQCVVIEGAQHLLPAVAPAVVSRSRLSQSER
jgi:hypothetical protein